MIKIRIWSFAPKYLDNVGLNRAINEAIAGYKALTLKGEGYPKAWEKHPQLERFKTGLNGLYNLQDYIDILLSNHVDRKLKEYNSQSIRFMTTHLHNIRQEMEVTTGQLKYEWKHYLKKLSKRNPELYKELVNIEMPDQHPLFKVIEGGIEQWERVK